MPGIPDDLLAGAGPGPSSGSQEPLEDNIHGPAEFEQEEIEVKTEPVFNVTSGIFTYLVAFWKFLPSRPPNPNT